MSRSDDDDQRLVTREWLDLKLSALRSDLVKLLVISVAGNQVLAHISVPAVVGFTSGCVVIVAVALKLFLFR